jgi:hypothetical protein
MEGVRAKGVLATGFGLAELLDSGEGIVILSLATVLVVAVVVLVVLSNDRLYDRVERLMRIAHGQGGTDPSSSRGGSTDDGPSQGPTTGRASWSGPLGRWLARRPRSDRPRVRR